MKTVRLIEVFNFTWQGEARDSGKKMLLLRFKRCNRVFNENSCEFCDTKIKMKISQESEYPINDLQLMIEENNLAVLISGGEPTFDLNLHGTVNIINNTKSYLYNVETNGYQLPELISQVNKNKNVRYVLSPKLFSYEDVTFYKDLIEKVKDNEKVDIKLVYQGSVFNDNFLDYLTEIKFDNNRIWLMPEGTTREDLLHNAPKVFDAAEKYKTNFSSREHIVYQFT